MISLLSILINWGLLDSSGASSISKKTAPRPNIGAPAKYCICDWSTSSEEKASKALLDGNKGRVLDAIDTLVDTL